MKQVGLVDYFSDFWNIVDSTQFIVFSYLTYLKVLGNGGKEEENVLQEVYLLEISLF